MKYQPGQTENLPQRLGGNRVTKVRRAALCEDKSEIYLMDTDGGPEIHVCMGTLVVVGTPPSNPTEEELNSKFDELIAYRNGKEQFVH